MFSAIQRRISYANVTATLALVLAMSGSALAARHYLISSTQQISPKVLHKLKGNRGANGHNGARAPAGSVGPAGPAGPAGAAGKEGPQGPGASELTLNLPASASPSFTKVGVIEGISLEAKCEEKAGEKVALDMTYTAPFALTFMQTDAKSLDGAPTIVTNEDFSDAMASTPAFWLELEAEKEKFSSERFQGNVTSSPKLLSTESYFVTGGPSGKCEGAIGMVPAG